MIQVYEVLSKKAIILAASELRNLNASGISFCLFTDELCLF